MSDLEHLAQVLLAAEAAREADVLALDNLSEDELAYLAGVDTLEDFLTDGVEGTCGLL